MLGRNIKLFGVNTSIKNLTKEMLINFSYGLFGNSIVVFTSKELDVPIIINLLLYYFLLSIIIDNNQQETNLSKYFIFPLFATIGAFVGYKLALSLSAIL